MSPRRLRFPLALLLAACLLTPVGTAGADINSRIETRRDRAAALRAAVIEESRKIKASAPALAAANARLEQLQVDNANKQARLKTVSEDLRRTRARLMRLIARQKDATAALEKNLAAMYRDGSPDLVSVALSADGFSQLLEAVDFVRRVAERNARILHRAKSARADVKKQTTSLAKQQKQARKLAKEVAEKTDKANVLQTALLEAQQARISRRSGASSALDEIRDELEKLRRELARTAQNGIAVNPGGVADAPVGSPPQVGLVVAAGNAIAGLPYLYGGGHAGFKDTAYDCSGSVSYALAAAGLVSSPMASGGFMSWGAAGPGKWITIYANSGHIFMVVGGWRFDTSALGGGTRWTRSMRPTGGFVARHPPGL